MKSENVKINGRSQLSGMFIYDDKNRLLLMHKIKHDHYETPGGKVEVLDLKNPEKPTTKDFRNAAIRETFEELGQGFIFEEPEYVKGIEFIKPSGKEGTSHKFKTKILFGEVKINEPDKFDELKWFSKEELRNEKNLAPDIKLFLKENLI